MKPFPALALVLSLSTAFALAQTTSAPKTKIQIANDPAPAPAAPAAKDTRAPAPAAKDTKVVPKKDEKKKEEKKKEEMGKIEGMEIARANGGFLGVRVVDGMWRLTFYNKMKKPTPPDVARAVFRWDAKYKLGEERLVLNPGGDQNSMTHPKTVRPPLTFKLFITLLSTAADGTDAASENYTIDFRQ